MDTSASSGITAFVARLAGARRLPFCPQRAASEVVRGGGLAPGPAGGSTRSGALPPTLVALFLATCATAAALPREIVRGSSAPWPRHTIDASSRGADGVKLGDLNGDGRPDLVTGWEEGGVVRVYLHPGPTAARAPWPQATVGRVTSAEDAIFADLDGDGRLEVVSCTEGKTRTVYWHRFTGAPGELLDATRWSTVAFPALAGAQMWMQAYAADLDGRHGSDLMLASKGPGSQLGWLEAPARAGDLAGWKFHPLRATDWVMTLEPHDLDSDGDLDAVFVDRKGPRSGVFWLENPGPSANRAGAPWREHAIGALGRHAMFADLGDLDGDGRTDVAVALKPNDILVCLRQPDGSWREVLLHLDAANLGDAKAVKVADFNGDGLADLAYTCENATGEREGVVWLERQRHGPWRQHSVGGSAGVKFDLLQALDLDGDGALDLLTCEERDQLGVIWYENPARPRP